MFQEPQFSRMKKALAGGAERRRLAELENEESDVDDDMSEADLSGSADVEEKNEDEDGSVFLVGDFVWGKIKNHPWWPGQIYPEFDASDLALKYKRKDKGSYLVAYFGDGTFSWCSSSQLMSFGENFMSFSGQSSTKSFVFAVEDALSVFSELVSQEMGCACVETDRQVAENAGIRKGVFVPMVSFGRLSAVQFESAAVIASVKNAARLVTGENKLELVMLSSTLFAFYRWKGYSELPRYRFPVYIDGLEDISKRRVDTDTVSLHNGLVSNKDKRCERRKEKRVTDKMEEMDTDVQGDRDCKKTPPTRRRRRRKHGGQTDLSGKGEAKGRKRAAGTSVLKDGGDKSRNGKRKKDCHTPVASFKQAGFEPVVLSLQMDSRVCEPMCKPAKSIIESTPIRKKCNIVFEKEPREDCNIKNEEHLLTTDQSVNKGKEGIDLIPEDIVSQFKPPSFIPHHGRPFGSKLDVFSLNKLSNNDSLMDEDNGEGQPLSAIIFITFSPGISLPSKTDLLTKFREFGPLNEEETDVLPNSLCAQVTFIQKSKGERAFNHMVKMNSSDSGTQYRIRYIPRGSSSENVLRNTQPLSVEYLKQKIKTITSILSNAEGEKLSNDLKKELHREITSLLANLT